MSISVSHDAATFRLFLQAYEISQWAAVKMPLYTGVQADHYAIQVRNVKTQMQDGIKFDFEVDYSIAGENGQSTVSIRASSRLFSLFATSELS